MKTISKTFLTGLLATLPIGLTVYILYWLGDSTESLLRQLLEWLTPGSLVYFPGMGIIVFAVAVFLIGVLLRSWVFRRIGVSCGVHQGLSLGVRGGCRTP